MPDRSVTACRALVARHARQRSGGGAWGFTPCSGAGVRTAPIFLPHGSHEIAVLLTAYTVQAFSGTPPPTTPSADFCAAVRPRSSRVGLVSEDCSSGRGFGPAATLQVATPCSTRRLSRAAKAA